jgi:hypothetical protein
MAAISVPPPGYAPAEASPVVSIQHAHRAASVLRAQAYLCRCGREPDEALAGALCTLARALEHAEPVAVLAPDPRVDEALDRLADLQALMRGAARDAEALVVELVSQDVRRVADDVRHLGRIAAMSARMLAETAGRLA